MVLVSGAFWVYQHADGGVVFQYESARSAGPV
jgi:hypothetical protein